MYSLVIAFVAIIGAAIANPILPLVHHEPIHHEHIHHAPQPYKFGYSVKDHHGEQHREEAGDGHAVRGSYGFTDDRGVARQVNYVADHGGFRAEVKTNEPGTANQNPAAVHMISDAPAHGYDHHGAYMVAPVAHIAVDGHHHGGYGLGYGYAAPYAAGYGYGYPGYSNGYGLASGLLGGLGYLRYGY